MSWTLDNAEDSTRAEDWEAHADDETAEEMSPENGLVWTTGYLTDRFPQTTSAIRYARVDEP